MPEEVEYTTVEYDAPAPSSMSEWPTKENPDTYYKVNFAENARNQDCGIVGTVFTKKISIEITYNHDTDQR